MFKKHRSEISSLEAEATRLRDREAQLATELESARLEIQRRTTDRQKLLGDDVEFDAGRVAIATADLDRAKSASADLEDAIAAIAQQRAKAEQRVLEERDRIAREDEVQRVDKLINIATRSTTELGTALRKFTDALAPLGIEGAAAAQIAHLAAEQLEFHAQTAVADAKQYRQGIRNGTQPLPAPVLEQEVVIPKVVDRTSVYLLQSAKWQDPAEGPQTAVKYAIVELPTGIAEKAVAAEIALPELSERAMRLRQVYGVHAYGATLTPLSDAAHDLDHLAETPEKAA